MLAGESLELRLASECWLRFSPKLNELATTFAISSPGEFIDILLELFAGRSPSEQASPQPSPSEHADECLFSLVPLPTFLCLKFQLFHAFFLHNNTQIKGTKLVYQCNAFHLKQR
jgi:hypothetical protein